MKNKEFKRLFTGLIAAGLCFAAPNGTLGISAFAEEIGGDIQETSTGSSDSPDAPTDPVDETETQESEVSQTDEKPEKDDDSQTDAQVNEIEHSDDEAADTDSNENTVPVVTAAQAPVPAAASEPDGPFWINDDTSISYTTLSEAVNAAADGSVVHMRGELDAEAVSGAVVSKNITLDVAADTTITGTGNENGFTLGHGSKLQTAEGATLTMTGFSTALTVDTGAVMTDGTYVFTDVNTGINLKGTMRGSDVSGSDQLRVKVTVTAKPGAAGIETTGTDLKFDHVSLVWNGGNNQDYSKCSLYAKNSDIIINNVWLDYKNGQPLNLYQCNVQISGKFSGSNNGFVLLVETNCSAEISESSVVVKMSRVNVVGELKIDNSTFTVMNSDSGGFNINYGGTLRVNNSKLKADHVDGAFIVAGWRETSNLYIDGSSVIETAGSSSADSIGVNGSFVVTGGSYKVDENQLTRDDLIPTNGESNGNEKLTLFHLADPSVSSISMINANGAAYPYPVTQANEDGQKRVWGPKASVVFRLNNGNATFADGTTADKNGTTIRGNSLNFVKGNTDPGTPVSKDKFLGWFYKDSQGTEHPFTMDTALTGNTEVYAKWNNISIVYHNGEGQSYIQSAQPGQTEMAVIGYSDIVNRSSDFAVQGKTFEYWTTAEDGTGTQYKKGDEISFENGQTQVDLYAYYGAKQYSVRFSANGGTFSENSIFRNPDYFTIETDNYGGETAVLKKTATYGQTLHELTEALGLDYNQLKPDADAVRSGYKLSDKTYWSTSAFSGEVSTVRFDDYKLWIWTMSGENPTITDDVTWYLQWKPTVDSSKLNGTITLPADIWHGGIENGSDSTRIQSVKPGDTVNLTAAVDVKEVKEKLEAIAGSFDVGPDEYSSIIITAPKCSFTATFDIPEGFAVLDETAVQVSADGLGSCFDVTKTNISGRKITVTFGLKSGIDNYQKLYDAVNSTGIKTALSESENDTITFKIAGLMVNGENKSDRDVLEIAGDVSGNFQAIATLDRNPDATSQGQSYYFAFTFKPSQTESGKDSNADSMNPISISYRLSKTQNLVLPADVSALVGTTEITEHDAVYPVNVGDPIELVGALDVSSIQEQLDDIAKEHGNPDGITLTNAEGKPGVDFGFTLKLKFPSGMSVAPDAVAEAVGDTFGKDAFMIKSANVDGQELTVQFGLENPSVDTFDELARIVRSAGPVMKIRLSGLKITGAGQQTVAVESLEGYFFATAKNGNDSTMTFNFSWSALQSTKGEGGLFTDNLGDGKDFSQDAGDNATIGFTLIASEKSSPVQPSKSDQPSAASSTVFPKTYALPHKFIPRTGAEN